MNRELLQIVDDYQQSRMRFAHAIAEIVQRPQHADAVLQAGIFPLLRSLILDPIATIQQSAVIALGRLASYSEALARESIPSEVLPQLVSLLSQDNKYLKRASVLVFRSAAKHSEGLAQLVVDSGALLAIVENGLKDSSDHPLQESAVWTIGNIAKHSPSLATQIVATGAVPLLIESATQTFDITLKRISFSALADIARHSFELTAQIATAPLLTCVITCLSHEDAGIRKQASSCLSQFVKHTNASDTSVQQMVLAQINLPSLVLALPDPTVAKNIATVFRDLVRENAQFARELVGSGAVPAIVECVATEAKLPAIMTLGYIGALEEELARSVFIANPVPVLKNGLINEPEETVRGAIVWALSQLGRHSVDLANRLAETDILRRICALRLHESSSEELKTQCLDSLTLLIDKTTVLGTLEVLINCLADVPDKALTEIVLHRFATLLTADPVGRKSFVQSGSLEKIQKMDDAPIEAINKLFPADLVNFYSPNYQAELLKQLDALPSE